MNLIRRALDRLFGAKAPPIPLGPGPNFAAELLWFVNAERRRRGLAPLRLNDKLVSCAQSRAELLARGEPGPPGPVEPMLIRAGYPCKSAGVVTARAVDTVRGALDVWLARSAVQLHLMGPKYHEAGFGVASALCGTRYWAGIFADPSDAH